ncbi:hypothetical protein DX902_09355 [Paenibacillus jamilae]|uniref:hypothetical protein n=1 Tax=Paenibacillus TaxID=44249 RepID=UPI000E3D8826|nr:hypothetical protein [Paenibacillus jamilae]RFT97709.1 hypothetical protein DX902_09355 [Paenibacillus jamilae]
MRLTQVDDAISKYSYVMDQLAWIDSRTLVYLAGSVFEGFGNASSDIDVFVITDTMPKIDSLLSQTEGLDPIVLSVNQFIVHNFVHDSVRFDFTYLTNEFFNSLLAKLEHFEVRSEEYPISFNADELDLLHRLKYATFLTCPQEMVERLRMLPFRSLDLYIALSESTNYTNIIEDIQGAYQSGDYGTAFFRTRHLLDASMTAFLAVNGESNPRLKWLFRKLKRYVDCTGDFDLLNNYLVYQNEAFDKNTVRDSIRRCLRYCQTLNDRTQHLIHKTIKELEKNEIRS